jgi:uncharacterized protein
MARRPHRRAWTSGARRRAAALWRPLLFGAGWLFLGVGIAGIFLPLVPGTLFLILAAACFTRSSPRFEAWLLDHPRLGPPIRQWRHTGAIPRNIKVYACLSLLASWLILLAVRAPDIVAIVCLAVFVAVGAFIATRPNR